MTWAGVPGRWLSSPQWPPSHIPNIPPTEQEETWILPPWLTEPLPGSSPVPSRGRLRLEGRQIGLCAGCSQSFSNSPCPQHRSHKHVRSLTHTRWQDTCLEGADQAVEFRGKRGLGVQEGSEDSMGKSLSRQEDRKHILHGDGRVKVPKPN